MEQVKDDKKFFHVFPTLRADDDVRLLFSDVEVKKITTNSRRDFLNIYILYLLYRIIKKTSAKKAPV